MIQDIPWHLLEKHFAQETDGNEERLVKNWLETATENRMIYDQLKNHYHTTGSLPLEFKPDAKAALEKVSPKITAKHKAFRISPVWYAAASIVVMLACLWWFFKNNTNITSGPFLVLNTIDSSRTITLSDGSRIWLNTGSSLEYPEKFGETREVILSGEGYFEVAHIPSHPFVVRTKNNVIRDLGTKFDVRAYHREETSSVIVTEGSVSFANHHNKQLIIKINQMCGYHENTGEFDPVSPIQPNYLAWKTKDFIFDNAPLNDVFQTLSSVYHFNYEFLRKDAALLKITTQFRSLSLPDITSIISLATKTDITTKTDKDQKLYVIIH